MATIRPDQLPPAPSVNPAAAIVVDDGVTVNKATPIQVVDSAIPLASQGEAEAGTDNVKRVTPLRVKQAIEALGLTQAAIAAPSGADLVGFLQNGTAAIARPVADKLRDILNAADFGVSASQTGANNATRLQAAIDHMLANSIDTLVLPAGEIQVSGDIVVGAHSEVGGNYLAMVTIEGAGAGVNGSWLRMLSGSLIVNAPCHSLRNFRVTSLTTDGIIIKPSTSPNRYPARSEMINVRAEYCAGSGIVIEDNWLYLMSNVYARQNANWGIEGRNGPLTGLACNSWTIVGGEIQGNGTLGGVPLGGGGSEKSIGGGINTGRSVQMNLFGVSIEGNKSDGMLIGEQTRGLLLQGCYFEKNGYHQSDRDIRNDPPGSSTNGPNSVVIVNSNFTPQNANGTAQERSIEICDCIDLRITNPQVFALSGPVIYSLEPIRVYETLGGRASGWVDGGWYSSSSYTQSFLKNECERYGYPKKHIFSTDAVLPDGAVTPVTPFVVPIPMTAGSRVDINHLTRPGVWGGGGGSGVARMVTTIRRGPAGTMVATRTDDINFVSSVNAIKTLNNTSNVDFRGNYVYAGIERNGTAVEDTLAVSATVMAVEIITYEGFISARED